MAYFYEIRSSTNAVLKRDGGFADVEAAKSAARADAKKMKNSHQPGVVNEYDLSTKVVFGQNGLPTKDSLAALAKEVAGKETTPQDPSSIRMNYFKTSNADTIRVKNLMNDLKGKNFPYFCISKNNCAGFTTMMLQVGGAINGATQGALSIDPNALFWELELLANQNYTSTQPKEQVTHCFLDDNGNCVSQ
jgi:hypothetical protein